MDCFQYFIPFKKNKLIVALQGGLGNQLFQYYTCLNLALKNGRDLMISKYLLEKDCIRNFKLEDIQNINLIQNPLLNYFYVKTALRIEEKNDFKYDTLKIPKRRNVLLEGYWQNEMYLKDIRDLILGQLNHVEKKHKTPQLPYKDKQKIAVHVRRGDYLNPINLKHHGVQTLDYYNRSISFLRTRLKNPQFIFFSDDILWCRNNFKSDDYSFSEGSDDWIDLFSMKNCDHYIIANSSFSWWAAWLNNSTNKIVVAPKKWVLFSMESPVPNDWIRM